MRMRRALGLLLMGMGALALLTPLASWVAGRREQELLLARFEWHAPGGSAPTPAVQGLPTADRAAGPSDPVAAPSDPTEVPSDPVGALSEPGGVPPEPGGVPSDPAGAPRLPRPDGSYRIEIPAAGIRYMVQEGIDDEPLVRGPGHYPKTPLPGEIGNAAIAGHRTVKGMPSFFYKLDSLKPGDTIVITYPDQTLTFAVDRVFLTGPYDISVLNPTPTPTLTLTTCDPPGLADRRLIGQARLP